ncbi:MAG: type II secretion system minor pseudopilin GspI [Proteobacteria bacterium]|nr:type II secretion system minor pseudopilin GspI [Pseudomonadota bacterium]
MKSRYHSGFTLVEILVALMIVAIAFAGVLGVVGQAADSSGSLRDRTLAMWLAQNRLTQHQLEKDWPSASTHTGTSDYAGIEWQWEEQVQSGPHKDIRRIEIHIRHKGEDHIMATLIGVLRKPPI